MAIDIRLPQLGESITHARLSQWLKNEGDRVHRGDVIAEVETDKTSVEIESPGDGRLSRILVAAGTDRVAVHELLAELDDGAGVAAVPGATTRSPDSTVTSLHAGGEMSVPQPASSLGSREVVLPPAADGQPPQAIAASMQPDDGHVSATPLARRMAHAIGLDLARIRGTGTGGRIMKRDIESLIGPPTLSSRAAARGAPVHHRPGTPVAPASDAAGFEVVQLSALRRVTGERLAQAKQDIPHFYLRIDCMMDALSSVRDQINARGTEKLSFTAFVLRAAALALMKVPAANSMWVDGVLRRYAAVDLAVAVSTPAGLIAPVVRGVQDKPVLAINREIRELAERARAGALGPDEYTGGTCTVSNLGMFGVSSLYPIINPPQTCILGVGAIEERPVVENHVLAVGLAMTCTLSADHRALDGATGAALLAAFKTLIEDPFALLL